MEGLPKPVEPPPLQPPPPPASPTVGPVAKSGSLVAFSDGANIFLRKGNNLCQLEAPAGGLTEPRVAGFSTDGAWLVFSSGVRRIFAVRVGSAAAPIDLTPRGGKVAVGEIFVGDGGLLVEIAGAAPGQPALYSKSLHFLA